MKKVIAIISTPQECGDQTIDFVSLESGKILSSITTSCFYDTYIFEDENVRYIGDEIVMYGKKYEKIYREERLVNKESPFPYLYYDEKCKKTNREWEGECLYVKEIEFISREPGGELELKDGRKLPYSQYYVYKLTLQKGEKYDEYNINNDIFFRELKERFDMELTYPEREGMRLKEDFIPMLAEHLGYEVVNVLSY
jgi:hypothetical protein